MDNTRGFVTFNVPANYDKVIAFAESPRATFEEIRKATPADREAIKKALYDFISNSRFENCRVNKGYVGALSFKTD